MGAVGTERWPSRLPRSTQGTLMTIRGIHHARRDRHPVLRRVRVSAVFAAVLCFAVVLGCSQGGAESRAAAPSYEVYRPADLSRSHRVPLVVGLGGSLTKIDSGLNSFADRYGFVVAYPDLSSITGPTEQATHRAKIRYVTNVIDKLTASENIDPRRVYVTGGSATGIESYRVACELSSKVAAIGSVAGSLLQKDRAVCRPPRPVSILEIHGTADTAVPYDGNQDFPPVRATNAFWRAVDRCRARKTLSTQGPVTIETWSPCRGATAVRLITFAGGGHGWPRNSQIDATAQLWSFFAAHPAASVALASVLRVVIVGSGTHRVLAVRLTLTKNATVRASLNRKRRSVGAKVFHVPAGTQTLRFGIAKRAPGGIYRLDLALTSSDGSRQSIGSTVRLRH